MATMKESTDLLRTQLARIFDWDEAHVGFEKSRRRHPRRQTWIGATRLRALCSGSCWSTCASHRKISSTSV